MNNDLNRLLDRIEKSPSCFHVIQNVRDELLSAGFSELREEETWHLLRGQQYFISRNDSSLIAFKIPHASAQGFLISASHCDSPSFKLKENPERIGANYVQLSTEKYGGMIMSSWFDRPLSVAGRIFIRENGKIFSRLVNVDRDLLLIPSVAIHMNRSVNDGVKYQANVDTLPLFGLPGCVSFHTLLAKEAGVSETEILGKDLFLYCRTKGSVFGVNNEFISAPKLDDLMCAFACLDGFLNAASADATTVLCIFDNEEVGSETKQGAGSSFLRDVLRRITFSLGGSEEKYLQMLSRSFMVSADNAHAVHPNHPEYADPDNFPRLNEGITIKFNANQRYATDGRSCAFFRAICADAGVKTQVLSNRSDLLGGSTLGSISNTLVPVSTVDIGLPQLAMHSAYETAGSNDYTDLILSMTQYYRSGAL